jgi:hypothetical protein
MEVGLNAVQSDAVSEGTEPIEVDGQEGLLISLDGAGDESGALATRAVMVQRGDLVWFFKLHGPKSLVNQESERFREFVRSVEFAE